MGNLQLVNIGSKEFKNIEKDKFIKSSYEEFKGIFTYGNTKDVKGDCNKDCPLLPFIGEWCMINYIHLYSYQSKFLSTLKNNSLSFLGDKPKVDSASEQTLPVSLPNYEVCAGTYEPEVMGYYIDTEAHVIYIISNNKLEDVHPDLYKNLMNGYKVRNFNYYKKYYDKLTKDSKFIFDNILTPLKG